ncbi:MAG: patatin-like phospholipase family protein [Betaproteobacteria bacterium]
MKQYRQTPRGKAMKRVHSVVLAVAGILLLLGGCATRPINPPITDVDRTTGYRYLTRAPHFKDPQNLVILAFSGGGTRAAAFSYGVLEALRRIEIIGPKGNSIRMLDEVKIITGVSGGSFTALAYGLYGEKLFGSYETSFLKRNVQGELIRRVLSPESWGDWGRAETAAKLYDEILFHGATFGDLDRGDGPWIIVSATDITNGARLPFHQGAFDVLCSNLDAVPLSRAATASSAVPFAFSPITLNNYGGTCNFSLPAFLTVFADPATAPRPASRALLRLQDLMFYEDGAHRPYIHLLDGGLSDNLGMRAVLEAVDDLEALSSVGQASPLDNIRRIIVFIVNSRSSPSTDWYEKEHPPGAIPLLIRATGVPIDHYSSDTIEQLKDAIARWQMMRRVRQSPAFDATKDPEAAKLLRTPNIDLYAIDVSFDALKDTAERDYLNDLPTSFVLPPEAIDRLRAAAATVIRESPDFKRLLKDAGARIVAQPVGGATEGPSAQ